MKKIAFLLLLTTLSLVGCGGTNSSSLDASVSSSQENFDVFSFSSKQMEVEVDTMTSIQFTSSSKPTLVSSDDRVVSISPNGVLVAKSVGEATITGRVGMVSDTLQVNVIPSHYSDMTLSLNRSSFLFSLEENTSFQIEATVTKGGEVIENPELSFTSLNEDIASISSTGVLSPIQEGTARIEVAYEGITTYFEADVYTKFISTCKQWLDMIQVQDQEKQRYCLINDLDFSSTSYEGFTNLLAGPSSGFAGEINGGGHYLRNITFGTTIDSHQSLFGSIKGALIRNIGFENVQFTSSTDYARENGIAGYASYSQNRKNKIQNVFLDLNFTSNVGERSGLFGNGYAFDIDNVYLKMNNLDGSVFNDDDALVSGKCFFWYGEGNGTISNSVLFSSSTLDCLASSGLSGNFGAIETRNIYKANGPMDALYGAKKVLDQDVWNLDGLVTPSLKVSTEDSK